MSIRFESIVPAAASILERFFSLVIITSGLQSNNDVAVRLFPFGMRRHIAVALECGVNDAALIRVHRFKFDRTSGSSYLEGNILCESFKRFFSSRTIVLGVRLHVDIRFGIMIDDKRDEILK